MEFWRRLFKKAWAPPTRECSSHEKELAMVSHRGTSKLTLAMDANATPAASNGLDCDDCGAILSTKSSLRRHKLYRHAVEKPYNCPKCPYHAVEPDNLKKHIRRRHTLEKPFRCSLCSYASADSSKVKRHQSKHSGDKPFACPECDMAFAHKTSALEHAKTHQAVRATFACALCESSFGRQRDLNRHVRRKHEAEAEAEAESAAERRFGAT